MYNDGKIKDKELCGMTSEQPVVLGRRGFFCGILTVLMSLSLMGCSDIGSITAEQSAGYEIYKEFCGQCHERQSPKRYTAEDWPDVVDRMRSHMKEKKKRELTDEQAEHLLVFLKGHAKKK